MRRNSVNTSLLTRGPNACGQANARSTTRVTRTVCFDRGKCLDLSITLVTRVLAYVWVKG